MTMKWRQEILPYVGPVLFMAGLTAVILLWMTGDSWQTMQQGVAGIVIGFGSLLGLTAYYLILWQLLLIGRVGWLEQAYGHDRLSRLHHTNGLIAWGLVGLHPILLVVGYASLSGQGWLKQTTTFLVSYPNVIWAAVAYVMYLSIVFVSLTLVRRHLPYEWWYSVHLLLYGAVVLSLLHQFSVGMDIVTPGRTAFWWGLVLFVAVNVLYWRFTRASLRWWRHRFRVQRVVEEAPGVVSVYLSGRMVDRFGARAGQFVLVRFLVWPWILQNHPFSLSKMPDGQGLRLTIKAVGDFTRTIKDVPPGARVLVEGPLGRFTSDRVGPGVSVAMIAGGIGITPLRALFEELAREGSREVDLVYAARTEQDLALRGELEGLAGVRAQVHYVPENSRGRLTPELLQELIPGLAGREVFLCGPPPMMKMVKQQLRGLGVPEERIHYEKFQLG